MGEIGNQKKYRSDFHDFVLEGIPEQLDGIFQVQFLQNIGFVVFDRSRAYKKTLSDLLQTKPLGKQADDLFFPERQLGCLASRMILQAFGITFIYDG